MYAHAKVRTYRELSQQCRGRNENTTEKEKDEKRVANGHLSTYEYAIQGLRVGSYILGIVTSDTNRR